MAEVLFNVSIDLGSAGSLKVPLSGYLKANGAGNAWTASATIPVADVTGAAADSAVVHLAGAETIPGLKTFDPASAAESVAAQFTNSGGGATQVRVGNSTNVWALRAASNVFQLYDITNGYSRIQVQPGGVVFNGTGNQLVDGLSSDNNAAQFRLRTDSTNRRVVALSAAGVTKSDIQLADDQVLLHGSGGALLGTFTTTGLNGTPVGATTRSTVACTTLDASGAITGSSTVTAAKSFQVDDVYALTAVSTAGQTRTYDAANGQVHTLTANQAFTIAATLTSGKLIDGMLFVYNSTGSGFTMTAGAGMTFDVAGVSPGACIGNATTIFRIINTGAGVVLQKYAIVGGDARPT